MLAFNAYYLIPIDTVQEERDGRKLFSMSVKCWSFVNTFHWPMGTAWEISCVTPVVQIRKLLSKVEWSIQSQIASQVLNPDLPDKVLPWLLHLSGSFPWAQALRSSLTKIPYKDPLIILAYFPFHHQWNHIIFGSWVEVQQDLCVNPFKTHTLSVVPKWNASCQIFLDILTKCTEEWSKDYQLGNKSFCERHSRASLHHSHLRLWDKSAMAREVTQAR